MTWHEDVQGNSNTIVIKAPSEAIKKKKRQIHSTHLNLPGSFKLQYSWTKVQYNSRNMGFMLKYHAVWDPGTLRMLIN